MSDFGVLDDCEGLQFQHGPQLHFSFDPKDDMSIALQVSNSHDLLFVSQNKTVCIYRLSSVISSAVANEPYESHLLDHITLEGYVEHMYVMSNINMAVLQLSYKIILYDFSRGMIKLESEFVNKLDQLQCGERNIFVRDECSILYELSLDGNKNEVMSDCKMMSQLGSGGLYVISVSDTTLNLHVFKEGENLDKAIPINLPEQYQSYDEKVLVGFHAISDSMFAIGMVVDEQDSLIVLYQLEEGAAKPLHWGFNELYFSPRNVPPTIEFHWIKEWECLFVWSNIATMVVVISRNGNLVSDRSWYVINMKEGYCLESIDIDCCPSTLAICTTYRDKLYRKKASEDSPLLTNPSVFLLAQGAYTVALHYADTWVIDANCQEIERLPRLGNSNDGSLFCSFKAHIDDKLDGCDSSGTAYAGEPFCNKDSGVLSPPLTVVSSMESNIQESEVKKLSKTNEGLEIESAEQAMGMVDSGGKRMEDVVPSTELGHECNSSMEILDEGMAALVKSIHTKAVTNYKRIEADKETVLERIRLTEMLCNSFDIFEHHLRDLESEDYRDELDVPELTVMDWMRQVEDLRYIQKNTTSGFNSINKSSTIGQNMIVASKCKDNLYDEAIELYMKDLTVDEFDADLHDVESHLNAVNEGLKIINQKLDAYENRIITNETQNILTINHMVKLPKEPRQPDSTSELNKLPDLASLIRQMKTKHAPIPVTGSIGYNEVHVKYNDYAEAYLKLSTKGEGVSVVPLYSENVSLGAKDTPESLLVLDDKSVDACDDKAELEVVNKINPVSKSTVYGSSSSETNEGLTPYKLENNEVHVLQEDNGNNSLASYSSSFREDTGEKERLPSTSESCATFPSSGLPNPSNVSTSVATTPTVDLFQRKSYTFNAECDLSKPTLTSGLQPLPTFTGSTTFASFAASSPMSFSSMAAASCNGGFFTRQDGSDTQTTSFGSAVYTGVSTSGSYTTSTFPTLQSSGTTPLLGLGSANASKDNANNAGSHLDNGIWSSTRRSNPLD